MRGFIPAAKSIFITWIRKLSRKKERIACKGMDAILVPGGFGKRGVEGKMMAIRYARMNRVPYLGICLGMQLAVIEYARDKAEMEGAHSTEFNPDTPYPVIALTTEWRTREGQVEDSQCQSRISAAACAWAGRNAC